MVDVLYFSDRDVKQKLFERVDAARRPLWVVQVRQDRHSRPPPEREPFVSVEREFGDVVDEVLVADEGAQEGMWRDPVGDLADHFFPDDRQASYAAATGYMLIARGRVVATVKKTGRASDDLWLIQEALAVNVPGVPPPDPSKRPGHKRARPGATGSGPRTQPPKADVRAPSLDPWQVLGIPRGTPITDAKKAFRALISQYHPDKVAHLAPEFRELADRRTREILEAWQQLEEAG